jgi:hypothetical protein
VNAWGLLLIGIGFLLMVIGVKGTQNQVRDAFKGVNQGQTAPFINDIFVGSGP